MHPAQRLRQNEPVSIDYSPLFAPISREQVAQFKRESRAVGAPWARTASAVNLLIAVIGGAVVILMATVFGPLVASAISMAGSGGGASVVFLLAPLALLAIGGFAAYRYVSGVSGRWASLLRRTRFASANGLRYHPGMDDPAYPGLIFSHGASRRTEDNYLGASGREFDVGNYRYTTGSGKNRTTHTWGYLALRLERKLPHMVLDARSNNSILGASSLPTSFRRDQRLSLEGDFDKYFTLYCPRQYERDALYVFTPDLMALLIDESESFDVEIVDDWMFVYSVDPFALDDAKTVNRLFQIIDTVGAKTLRQTDRYADERIGDAAINLVAPQGQRLKQGVTAASVGIFILVAWVGFTFLRSWF